MRLEDYFPPEEAESAKRYVEIFHDSILINDKLSSTKTLLLCVYMLSNSKKISSLKISDIKLLFLQAGRSEIEFSKALYEVTARQKEPALKKWDETVKLTYSGVKVIKNLLHNDKSD